MKRLQDASCAICMDSLFDLRDDLDEVLPIATPDCGESVFRERSERSERAVFSLPLFHALLSRLFAAFPPETVVFQLSTS